VSVTWERADGAWTSVTKAVEEPPITPVSVTTRVISETRHCPTSSAFHGRTRGTKGTSTVIRSISVMRMGTYPPAPSVTPAWEGVTHRNAVAYP